MAKRRHKHSHFIPSSFPTVTEYENTFIKVWNKNTAKVVAEVLQYMARATTFAIKEKSRGKK